MIYILNIETSTTVCSVSLSGNGELICHRELDAGFTHAENLHLFVQQIVRESGISLKKLNAVAISKGPGSYTGLRIGVSSAKGLAYALNLPLIGVDTLQLMCNHPLIPKPTGASCCPMIDARRMEVYTGLYDTELKQQLQIEALIVDENSVRKYKNYPKLYFFGNGMNKCVDILKSLANAEFIENVVPSAQYMCSLSFEKFKAGKFEDVAYFEPFYLKDFLMLKK